MAFSFGGFGQSQQQAQPSTSKPTFSFGNTSSTPAPAAGTGTGTTSGFSFGSTANNNTTNQAGGTSQPNLFGSTAANQQQGQQQQQPQQQGTGSSLFGGFGAGTSTNSNNTAGTGTTGQPASQPFSFGGFGAKPAGTSTSTTTPAPAPAGGLFSGFASNSASQNKTEPPKPAFSFGGSTAAPAAPAASGGLNFGGSTSQPPAGQQQNQVASTSSAPITKSTRFEDLPEPARKAIEEIETYIQGRIAIYDSLKAEKLGKEIEETSLTLRQISTEFAALSNHLAHDNRHTTDLRSRFEQSLKDAVKAAQIVDAFRAPTTNQPGSVASQAPKPHPTFLHDFFRRKTEELVERLATYKTSIEQIQALLSRSDPDQVKAILPTLRAQHAATLQLASKLSAIEGDMVELKDGYRDLWRERTGSVRDPFIERRREVLGADAGMLEAVNGLAIR